MQKVEVAAAKPGGGVEAAQIEDTSLPGMAFMMECYEGELKRPIRNLVNGRLLRTILIQVEFLPGICLHLCTSISKPAEYPSCCCYCSISSISCAGFLIVTVHVGTCCRIQVSC